ncbi:MAG: hypothetical protein DYG98_23410 [Haliscomenobacteraceae bacterium CHB4]|nr:hypothetical protein [Saprospiraceae bacterium]MCE7926008.1 hypothetical protein [Haliscomenobacteraceae bacterium CHB4]
MSRSNPDFFHFFRSFGVAYAKFFMPMEKRFALFTVLFAWCSLSAQSPVAPAPIVAHRSAFAQASVNKPANACFLHYTTSQGLSSDYIKAIVKDNQGFLWVGTVNGLNRFDGRFFKIFRHDPKNKNSIPHNQILGITKAPDGALWIATLGGLCKLDPYTLVFQQIALPENADTLPHNDAVTMVAFDSKGMAWTTGNSAIYSIHPVTGELDHIVKTPEGMLGWFWMFIDKQDRLWMCKDRLRRFDPHTGQFRLFEGVNPKESFVKAGPFSVVQDISGRIWAGTWYNGIWEYLAESDDFAKYTPSPSFAMMLLPDASAAGEAFLWVGGGLSGLGVYYPETKQFFDFAPDLRDPFTHNNYLGSSLFKDPSNGDVWVGTEVGLEHYAPATIRFGRAMIPLEKDMGQFSLVSGAVRDRTDPSGHRYFIAVWGTGLFSWNKETGKFVRMKSARSKMTGGGNFNLLQDSRGYVWACMKSGVGRYDPRTGAMVDYDHFFEHKERNNLIWCGLEDRQGNLWFGSNKEGLFRYDPRKNRVESMFYKKELAEASGNIDIRQISEDTQGRLWLACYSGGLLRFDPGTGEARKFSYPGQNVCTAVVAAASGRIYAVLHDALLELNDKGELLRRFTQYNGLKTHRLLYMVEDLQGKMWINSEYLLHCFDPATGTFSYYGSPDGLFSNTMTDALSITPEGEIFIGFQNAFNFFYPERLRRNLQPPPIAITSVKVMNKERDIRKNDTVNEIEYDSLLVLRPGEDFFEIEFAALNFNQQERNRYAYLLEGFNKEWVFTERPVATFTNLDGGTYLLRMKAANNDGIWNEQGVALAIRVIPPFYRTWWFFVLMALATAGIAAGLLRVRWQQRRRLEKFRESLARDLHDELGSTLSSIRFFSDFANQQIGEDKPQVKPVLQRISESASALSESMQDIIWAMKTKNDQTEDLAARMTEFGYGLLEARNIDFKTHISVDISGKHLHPQVRRNVYLIFKEALNNAAKYSNAKEVELDFVVKKGWLLMKINDNGLGFEADSLRAEGGGNGLQNMRKRAADIGGKLDIISGPGEGTSVELRVKT